MIYTKGPKTPSFIEVVIFAIPVRDCRHSILNQPGPLAQTRPYLALSHPYSLVNDPCSDFLAVSMPEGSAL
jgi:hypothetical protein